jgi:flagellar associated repeat protein
MNPKRTSALLLSAALLGTGLSVLATPSAVAAGGGGGTRLQVTGSCGDILDLREQTIGTITVTITIPSSDSTEVWSLAAQQQEYGPVTGGREGNPINLVPNPLPPLAFSPAEGGFTTTADFANQPGFTHGWSYTATRTSPTPVTCTNRGFWTNPGTGTEPVVPPNPIDRPNTAPALTGATEADSGTTDVLLQFDQEMLDTAQGIPATNRFAITVDGVARTVTGVQLFDDSPPQNAVVDVTFGGAALTTGQTVGVTYRKPLTAGTAQLQDLDGLKTNNFGPLSVPAF